jgi:ectoine hydroxylase-related dioxygenase (phytanoyl-CoA dioxygenase family)
VLAGVRHVLGEEFKLSSLNARSADPGSEEGQPLHVDMGAVPDERGYWVCNTVWMLDDFTTENGATRMIPGSHHWRKRPQDVLEDVMAPHPGEVLLTGKAGSIAIMNAHLWHGGTANTSNQIRPMTSVGYFAPWFRMPGGEPEIPRASYEQMTPTAKKLCRTWVKPD